MQAEQVTLTRNKKPTSSDCYVNSDDGTLLDELHFKNPSLRDPVADNRPGQEFEDRVCPGSVPKWGLKEMESSSTFNSPWIGENVRIYGFPSWSFSLQQLDSKGIYSLRLVCKAFEALVTPLAFKTLPFVRNYSDNNHGNRLVTQIQALATGASPYSQWAHTLLIDHGGLYPYLKRSPSYETNKKKALDGRAQFLVPAIESLRNLKRARFVIFSF
ncbi:hypothetical protein NMY22_g17395 [Coprinellus aureogranulatus]|nr:hypothetical protein NMY22_g17395 [Coprinellus aureogranulatus]